MSGNYNEIRVPEGIADILRKAKGRRHEGQEMVYEQVPFGTKLVEFVKVIYNISVKSRGTIEEIIKLELSEFIKRNPGMKLHKHTSAMDKFGAGVYKFYFFRQ